LAKWTSRIVLASIVVLVVVAVLIVALTRG